MTADSSQTTHKMRGKLVLEELTPDHLRRVAKIIGPGSAAAHALGEMDARRREGQDPHAYWTGTTIIIGPNLDV